MDNDNRCTCENSSFCNNCGTTTICQVEPTGYTGYTGTLGATGYIGYTGPNLLGRSIVPFSTGIGGFTDSDNSSGVSTNFF